MENEKNEIEEKVNCYLSGTIQTKINNRYTDAVSATYQDLACTGVGTNHVETVIKSVLDNPTNLEVHCPPKPTFSRLMFTDSRRLSQLQITESFISNYEKSCNTLHSDETSKFWKHYEAYIMLLLENASV